MSFDQSVFSQFPIGLVGPIQERKRSKTIIDFQNLVRSWLRGGLIQSMSELYRLMDLVVQVIQMQCADEIELVLPRFQINDIPYQSYVHLMMASIQFYVPNRIRQATKFTIHIASWSFQNDHECDDRLIALLYERAVKQGYDALIVSNDRYRSLDTHSDKQVIFESFDVPFADKMDLDGPTSQNIIAELERFASVSSKQSNVSQIRDCRSHDRLRRVGFEFRGSSVIVDPMRD